jgi:3-(3-hydroxy-phenyl)propionate hydroxylase
MHDVDNLCWKLAKVVKGEAAPDLLQSYDEERRRGADENMRHSARATTFMSPPDPAARLFRDEALRLAAGLPFARRLINSGRLSDPCSLGGTGLQTLDASGLARVRPGDVCPDAPVAGGWLLGRLGGRFVLMVIGTDVPATDLPVLTLDNEGLITTRYGRGVYLVRPDQHVAAYWPTPASADDIAEAVRRAGGGRP